MPLGGVRFLFSIWRDFLIIVIVSRVKFFIDADVGEVPPESDPPGVDIMSCDDAGRMIESVLKSIGIIRTDEDLALSETGGCVEMIGQDDECRLFGEILQTHTRIFGQPSTELGPFGIDRKVSAEIHDPCIEGYVFGATMFVETFQQR